MSTNHTQDNAALNSENGGGASTARREDQAGRTRRRFVGGVLGLLLFAGAVASIVHAGEGTRAAMARIFEAPPAVLALLLVLPIANLMLTSMCFQALTRRYAFVEPREMHALIAASFLLNFLPLRPGLFGRVAYHTKIHRMRVRDAARILVEAIGCTAVAMLLLLGTLALSGFAPALSSAFLGVATIGLVLTWMWARQNRNLTVRAYALATLIKLADILLWGARYVVVFALLGQPIQSRQGISLAVVANAASLVPLAGNGLGLREWAVGIVAATLPARGASTIVVETGLSADLINRGAEILVALALGIPSLIWLSRRMARARGDN